jgi:pimeloyl-ACP methyl ester carboxylesterase
VFRFGLSYGAAALVACTSGTPPRAAALPVVESPLANLPNVRATVTEEQVFGGAFYAISAGVDTQLPPILFVHGLGENGVRDWYPVFSAFAQTRRVYALDLPGFGRSARNNYYYNPVAYAELLAQVIRTQLGGQADVVGHSMGGAIALGLAGTEPGLVRQLVLIDVAGILCQEALVHAYANPLPQVKGLAADTQRAAGSILHELVTGFAGLTRSVTSILLSPALRESLLSADPQRIAGLALIDTDFGPVLRRVSAPTLLLWGQQDGVAPMRTFDLLRAKLPVQHAEVFPAAGHNLPLERPDQVIAALTPFLAAQGPTSPGPLPGPQPGVTTGLVVGSPLLSANLSQLPETECRNRSHVEYTGAIGKLTLINCTHVRVHDARLEALIADNSAVELTHVSVARGTLLRDSQLTMTGGTLAGERALELDNGVADLAGVTLDGAQTAVLTTPKERSRLVASIVSVHSGGKTFALHGVTNFQAGQSL